MPKCPCCNGERGFDMSAMDVPLARLGRLFGASYEPMGYEECPTCLGTGEVPPELARDYEAWAVACVDQLLAAVDSGEVVVP